jgi:hypothetical protein
MKCKCGKTPLIKGSYLERPLRFCASLALAALLATSASTSCAAIVFSDDFSSGNGPLLGTTADVGGVWTITGTSVVNPLLVASGAVAVQNNGQDAYAAFAPAVPHTIGGLQTSADINVSAAQVGGDYFLHLSDPVGTTSNFYQRLFARSSGNGYQLGLVDTSGTGSTITYGSTVLAFGTSYDVDVTWNFIPGATNDTFALTVNNLPYLLHTWTSALAEPTQVSAANFRQGAAGNAPTLTVDNLVVTSIIPEPSTLILGGVFGLLGIVCRNRRDQ